MRLSSFAYCVVLTGVVTFLYIRQHNHLTEFRIRAISLEKEVKIEEAKKRRLELEMACFTSPIRLEDIAKKPQYSHLHHPTTDEVVVLDY